MSNSLKASFSVLNFDRSSLNHSKNISSISPPGISILKLFSGLTCEISRIISKRAYPALEKSSGRFFPLTFMPISAVLKTSQGEVFRKRFLILPCI